MAVFSLFVMFFQIFIMELTQGHYTIDIVAGLIFGHYIHMLVLKYTSNEPMASKSLEPTRQTPS